MLRFTNGSWKKCRKQINRKGGNCYALQLEAVARRDSRRSRRY